ncbi:D-alanyl-D-alanine carboxypeptidase [Cryobacterium melibiosiphilum]|uniref:D-alanyl-D-alanine carboxypeptidase n=1 Tax=Cryobacterium melibiosiphilum TaxID=995039 RepID=A0A3A5MK64_9MICO|nr:D-alanyl-D-alanine carboxypeptidase [Cryobacterium melibiosiphilum]RJT84632.1 D-alanyl-D-alanine carboxypeptidase [Cryobacterium melibiosiphilum]
MSRFRPGRFVGILTGTVVILGVGVYGPATLLGPLPAATMTVVTPDAVVSTLSPPVLPAAGASAVVTLGLARPASDAASTSVEADATTPAVEAVTPIAVGGTSEALPMASIAKVITALVVLDAKPITDGVGPTITLTAADYQSYLDYSNQFSRSLPVFTGETWTEQEMLQAMLLGSSNNHADSLARWAFGSVDAYAEAATDWLAANGLSGTRVVDATGLDADSVGTGTDLARIAALAATDPVVSDIIAHPASALAGRGIDNRTEFMSDEGVTGLSNSYTDAAGLCLLFTAQVVSGDSTFVFAGAIVGEPDQDTLDADMAALLASAQAGVAELPLLASGAAYASFDTEWGETASAVVGVPKTQVGWQAVATGAADVTVDAFATGRKGETIGRVQVETGDGSTVSSPLELDRTIRDPGAGWRLLNPGPVIGALIASRS